MMNKSDNLFPVCIQIRVYCQLHFLFYLDFFYYLYKFRAAESKFKNIILTTYHEESLKILNQVFETFRCKSEFARKFWKPVREKLHEKLKPSYGHYRNVYALESLVDDFQRVFAKCSKTLSDLCSITEVSKYYVILFNCK